MNIDDFQQQSMRTAKRVDQAYDLTHAALGLTGEAGEFCDAIKKHVIYGKPLDRGNALEELGDILWFCALAADTLGVNLSEVAEMNVQKLRLRYPEKYSDNLAKQRLDKEVA